MRHRCLAIVIAAAAVMCLAPLPAVGQAPSQGPDVSTPPRLLDGRPDLRGVWDFRTITPLQRPSSLADKEFLTAEEAAEFEQQQAEQRNADRRDGGAQADVARAYNDFWWDYGSNVVGDRRTSLVVDPPDGRIPSRTDAVRERQRARREARRGRGPSDSWVDRSLWERCIVGFNSGPPMFPSAYNNNFQLFQTPDHVVILNEMVHAARVVTLDGSQHVSGELRQWMGDSRGHWEGDTLVVDTTNFTAASITPYIQGSGESMHLVERFTRVNADTLLYQYTVDDPTTWTSSWTVSLPMRRSDGQIYEYACHKGNYGMTNLLVGARVEEKAAPEETATTDSR